MSPLPAEAEAIIQEEASVLANVLGSLRDQKTHHQQRLQVETARARDLTSILVASRRVDDKALMASDEAVSHAMADRNQQALKTLDQLLKRPYFARIVLEEEDAKGGTKTIEYKLGFAANPDTRIIDWRKAPISKLFYEYKEGEEYSEEILGRERTGRVRLKHTLEIEKGSLKRISCSAGNFLCKDGEWIKLDPGAREGSSGAGHLKEILSLITPEQFRLITEDSETAILIQGVAGSGKTTVALHRLAWLLHEREDAPAPEDVLFLVHSKVLKNYASLTLPSMGIEGVRVLTFAEWAQETLRSAVPDYFSDGAPRRPQDACSSSMARLKRSMAFLRVLEDVAVNSNCELSQIISTVLMRPKELMERDETKLIDRDLIEKTYERSLRLSAEKSLDFTDDALIMRAFELRQGGVQRPGGAIDRYRYLAVDEVQDWSAPELACVVGGVKEVSGLTLVGDTSQQIDPQVVFPGWEALRRHWNFKESMSKYITLNISFRSTVPIMNLAAHVQGSLPVREGRGGRVPIWFRAPGEQKALRAAMQWISTATQRYPTEITAVICANSQEARYVLSLLEPTFGGGVRLGDQDSFSFDAGVLVAENSHVKGLEFCNVLIWNPSDKSYPDTPIAKNLLYVGITRAIENLCLVSWTRQSIWLSRGISGLVRINDVE